MTTDSTGCRWTPDGHYLPTHTPTCTSRDCPGCTPCTHDHNGNPVRHCTAKTRCTGHLDPSQRLTCTSCIDRTRRDLRALVDLDLRMATEALAQGVGSEAAMLSGPAADITRWLETQVAWANYGGEEGAIMVEALDPHHPLTVLGWWDMALREDYGPPTQLRVTVKRAADYLDGQLTRLAQDPQQEFALFAREVLVCRLHLEAVLHDSRRPETGAPCPDCAVPVVKRWGSSARYDHWRCPKCERTWEPGEYDNVLEAQHNQRADRLTAKGLAVRLQTPASTVRRWASTIRRQRPGERPREYPPAMRPCGQDGRGRWLYRVAAAEDILRGWCDWPRSTGIHDTPASDEVPGAHVA